MPQSISPREIPSSLAFRKSSESESTVRYEDPLDNRITVWLKNGRIIGFQLQFNDKVMEYENGSYRYFEITDDRGPTGYPAPSVTIFRKYIKKEYFLKILEDRSQRMNTEQIDFIMEKVRLAKGNPGGL